MTLNILGIVYGGQVTAACILKDDKLHSYKIILNNNSL